MKNWCRPSPLLAPSTILGWILDPQAWDGAFDTCTYHTPPWGHVIPVTWRYAGHLPAASFDHTGCREVRSGSLLPPQYCRLPAPHRQGLFLFINLPTQLLLSPGSKVLILLCTLDQVGENIPSWNLLSVIFTSNINMLLLVSAAERKFANQSSVAAPFVVPFSQSAPIWYWFSLVSVTTPLTVNVYIWAIRHSSKVTLAWILTDFARIDWLWNCRTPSKERITHHLQPLLHPLYAPNI